MDVTERTLTGLRREYVSDLNHTNTLRELHRKLPLFIRVKWTECAGRIIEPDQRPSSMDFLHFLKQIAPLMNKEFGEDLNCSPSKNKEKAQAEMVGINLLTSLQQWLQVYTMIEVLNINTCKE